MEVKNYFAQDDKGNILPNASVYLYKKGTNELVSVFDKNGSQKTNPFTAESNGLVQFSAADGEYDLRISSGGREYKIDINLFDSKIWSEIGSVRFASACESIKHLLMIGSPSNNQRIDVLGFYTDNLRGGGTFRFRSSISKSEHDGITVISPTVPFDGTPANVVSFLSGDGETDPAGLGCWARILQSSVITTAMAGAIIDGTTQTDIICQLAHNTGHHIEYSSGSYKFNYHVKPQPNQKIFSEGAGLFNMNNKRNVYIENMNDDGGIFHYTDDTSWGQVDAPNIYGFKLKADYPIMLNSHMAYIADGEDGECPYLMKPYITNNNIESRIVGRGIGIVAAKCFDGLIEGNDVYNFTIPILLLGSDLNEVRRNRIVGHTLYGICDRSAGTFGSQNDITKNDILAGGPSSTYIKTTARHIRLNDNYCEQPSGSLNGFIDMSPNGLPVWNPKNIDSKPHSIFAKGNRLDGWGFCTEFVYRLNGDQPASMTVIEDSSTTGQPANVDVLSIVSSDNTKMLRYTRDVSNGNFPEYYLRGQFKSFSGFDTQFMCADLEINARNLTKVIGSDILGNGAGEYVKTNGEAFCLLPGLANPFFMRFPMNTDAEHVANIYLADGVTYTCEIIARTTTPIGDVLKAARLVNNSGDPLNSFSLTQQWKKFTFTMSGTAATNRAGVYLVRDTQNGIIEIKSILFKQTM